MDGSLIMFGMYRHDEFVVTPAYRMKSFVEGTWTELKADGV